MIQKQSDLFHFCLKLKHIVKINTSTLNRVFLQQNSYVSTGRKLGQNWCKVQKSFPKSIKYLKCSRTRLTFTFTLFHLALGYQIYVKYLFLDFLELTGNFILLKQFHIYRPMKQLACILSCHYLHHKVVKKIKQNGMCTSISNTYEILLKHLLILLFTFDSFLQNLKRNQDINHFFINISCIQRF